MTVTLPVLLTAADVAKALKVSAKTIQREVADGRLACTMVRKSMRFAEQQVLAYLERQRVNAETKVGDTPQQQPASRPCRADEQVAAILKAKQILDRSRSKGD